MDIDVYNSASGYNVVRPVPVSRINGTDDANITLDLLEIPQWAVIRGVSYHLETPFDGGDTLTLKLDIGDDDDDDGFIDNLEIHEDGTTIVSEIQNGAYFSGAATAGADGAVDTNVKNGKRYNVGTKKVKAKFTVTATADNQLSKLTEGKVIVLLDIATPAAY